MYGTVDQVKEWFDSQQWDPQTDEPDQATVTAWLTTWGDVLDGEIGHVVSTPIELAVSPKLAAVCAQITVLRCRADVFDRVYPPDSGDDYRARPSYVWRSQAEELVKRIGAGAVADGVALGGRSPEAPGAPAGYFGEGAPAFTSDQVF